MNFRNFKFIYVSSLINLWSYLIVISLFSILFFSDIFKPDPNFLENEKRYEELRKTILGEESEDEDGSDAVSDEDDEDDESDEEDEESMQIKDETETNLVNLRRTIYLTIMSSVDFEEAGHKLLKIKLEPGQEVSMESLLEVTFLLPKLTVHFLFLCIGS